MQFLGSTGLVGIDTVLKDLVESMRQASDKELAAEMIQRLSKKNYIPSGACEEYETAFVREF